MEALLSGPCTGLDLFASQEARHHLLGRTHVGLARVDVSADLRMQGVKRRCEALILGPPERDPVSFGSRGLVGVEAGPWHGVGEHGDLALLAIAFVLGELHQAEHEGLHGATRAELRQDPRIVESCIALHVDADAAIEHLGRQDTVGFDLGSEAFDVGQGTEGRLVVHDRGDVLLEPHEVRCGQQRVAEGLEEALDVRIGGLETAQAGARHAQGLVPGRRSDHVRGAEAQDRLGALISVEEAILLVHEQQDTTLGHELGYHFALLHTPPAEAGRVGGHLEPQDLGGLGHALLPLLACLRQAEVVLGGQNKGTHLATVGLGQHLGVGPRGLDEADLVAGIGEELNHDLASTNAAGGDQDILGTVVDTGHVGQPLGVGLQQTVISPAVARVVLVMADIATSATVHHLGRQAFVLANSERKERQVVLVAGGFGLGVVHQRAEQAQSRLASSDDLSALGKRPGALRGLGSQLVRSASVEASMGVQLVAVHVDRFDPMRVRTGFGSRHVNLLRV